MSDPLEELQRQIDWLTAQLEELRTIESGTGLKDYTASSTITGWSSFTEQLIEYFKDGKKVFVNFRLVGTSNAVSASFTLPFAEASSSAFLAIILTRDNTGTRTLGYVDIVGSTATLRYTPGTTGWTAAGTKEAYGQFFYYAA